MTTLGEVCEVLDKKRKPITKRDRVAGPYPYYGATGILDYVEDWIFDERLILLGEDGAKWGRNEQSAFIIDGRTWVNNHAHVLNPRRDVVDDRYVTYYLNHISLDPFISGTTIPKLTQKSMVNIQIPLPPLDEQKRIAEILDEADRVRKKTQALIDKYDELAQSIFLDMFGDPVTNPKGWEVKPLGEICEFFGGKAWKRKELTPSGMRLVRISNLHNPNFKWWHYDGPFVEKYAVEQGDLLFSWAGVASSIDVYLYHGELAMLNQHIYNLKPAKEGFPKDYLFEFIRQLLPHLRNQMGGGVGQFYLKKSDIQGIQIFCAPTDILEQYRERARLIETQKNEALAHYRFESSLFNALLQKAFKGELT